MNGDRATGDEAGIGTLRIVLTVFLPFAGGFYLSYLFRSVNAVLAPHLVRDLGLGAGDLGMLTAVYFLAFAAFQLPLGVMLDRFGARRVQSCLLLIAAAGAFLFAAGQDVATLALGRALVGLGVAGGLMASLKAITQWFPRERWPLANGCFVATGGIGAMSATAPVEALLHLTDWRGVFVLLGVLTVAMSALIAAIVPERQSGLTRSTLRQQGRELARVYGDRLFWRVAPAAAVTLAANMSIQGLWAGPWLRDVAGFDHDMTAVWLLAIAFAMTLGSAALGPLADTAGRIGIGTVPLMAAGVLVFCTAQGVVAFALAPTALWPWVLFGLLANIGVLAYAHLSRHFPLDYAGRANTGVNLLAFSSAFLMQSLIGAIIDLWPASAGHYPVEAYRTAFGAVLGIQAAALLWLLVPDRTR